MTRFVQPEPPVVTWVLATNGEHGTGRLNWRLTANFRADHQTLGGAAASVAGRRRARFTKGAYCRP